MYETYTDKNGRVCNIYNLGRYGQIRMEDKGWRLRITQTVKDEGAVYVRSETPQELYDRLSKQYAKVKVYYSGTMVRGIHSYYAFCKY